MGRSREGFLLPPVVSEDIVGFGVFVELDVINGIIILSRGVSMVKVLYI